MDKCDQLDPSYLQRNLGVPGQGNRRTSPDDALNELEKAQAYTADRLSLLADRLHRVLDQNERPTAEPSGLATSCPLHTLLNERIYKQASINAVLDEILERLAL